MLEVDKIRMFSLLRSLIQNLCCIFDDHHEMKSRFGSKKIFIFKSVRCSNHFWPEHGQRCAFRVLIFHRCAVQQFAQLFLFTLIAEWVWRRGRISHGSSSKGFSRALKLFEDLTGTGVTKTVSDHVCVSNGCKGMFLTANTANYLLPSTPLNDSCPQTIITF